MAYPKEKTHIRYIDYAIAESEGGRKPMRKGPWKAKQAADAKAKAAKNK